MDMVIFQHFDFDIIPDLALLFGIAAQFTAMDGSVFLRRTLGIFERKVGMVYAVAIVAGLFSPFILNDVVILILTPVLVKYVKQFSLGAASLLVAEITFVNTASSLTPFGNPQNIILWTTSGASLAQFIGGTWVAVLLSGVIAAAALLPFSRRIGGARESPSPIMSLAPLAYLVLVAVAIFVADLLGLPSHISLGAGFVLGFVFTFRSLPRIAEAFDLRSLLTLYVFVGSVAVVGTILSPILAPYVQPAADGAQPYSALFIATVSNLISNVPTTQLVLSVSRVTPALASKLAVEAGFAGNISPVGSFANILALQIARRAGLPLKRAIMMQFVVGILSFLPAFV